MNESALRVDLDEILERSGDDLRALRGMNLFITGGTGFVGSWFLETIVWANLRLNLDIAATVLTRDAAAFQLLRPHLACAPDVTMLVGDVRSLPATHSKFDAVVHAATPASAALNNNEPLVMLDTIVDGGRKVLEFAAASGSIPVLFTSSGAVYGVQPSSMERIPETYNGAPDPLDPGRAYHEGKRIGELQCALFARGSGIAPKIARMFAFVGPYLPLDRHFAIGNFIGDALGGVPIKVRGDGSTIRSYQYASEMIVWLLAILLRGEVLRAYNVGSEEWYDMRAIAETVNTVADARFPIEVARVRNPNEGVDRYVPDTSRARAELAVDNRIRLDEAIRRTVNYHVSNRD
jgi:dTDP-glucose 4,6-dehydratase